MKPIMFAGLPVQALVALLGVAMPLGALLTPDPAQGQATEGMGNLLREALSLDVGAQKVLPSSGVRSFSEGVKGIVDIRLTKDNSQFVVVGLRAGKTTLLFIMQDGGEVHYEVTVADPNAAPVQRAGRVERRDNIRLDFYFVQLSSSYSHSLGIGWPTSVGGEVAVDINYDLAAGALSSASAVVSSQVLPRLDFAQADGWAKVMRKAALITANGTQANFSGGGEINIPVTGGFGGSIKQVSFGSQIGVLPRYDKHSGRMELQITADVSDLAPDTGTGVPGRTISTLQTVVNLELGQSLVLAGLSAASQSGANSGLPGLSQIPLFGVLFGTDSSRSSQTQNVVFIVPTVMDTASLQERALIDEAFSAYENYSGNMEEAAPMMPGREITQGASPVPGKRGTKSKFEYPPKK